MSETSASVQSSAGAQGQNSSRWTEEEHLAYLSALETIPKQNAQQIADFVETKNAKQVASHSQKLFEKLKKQFEKPDISEQQIINTLRRTQDNLRHVRKETLLQVIQTVDNYFQLHPERKEQAHHLGCYVTTYL